MQGRDANVKKLLCGLLCCVLCLPAAGAISAKSAIVIDTDTGEVVFEENAEACLPVAIIT